MGLKTAHKAALRDPVVELDLAGKALNDECFSSITEALVASISYNAGSGRVTRLEELSLNHNQLTVQALESLGWIIKLSSGELRDLDISHNAINVTSQEDARRFQVFLESFADCHMLRRIDFSGNDLGVKGFEVFARVYGNQTLEPSKLDSAPQTPSGKGYMEENKLKPLKEVNGNRGLVDFSPLGLNFDIIGLADAGNSGQGSQQTVCYSKDIENGLPTIKESVEENRTAQYKENTYKLTRGLRSVPYLVFQDTNMNDASALFLSYIIPIHQPPEELLLHVPPARAGAPAQQLSRYDLQSGCLGIVYRPNRKIDATGVRLLELSEQLRSGFSDSSDGDDSFPSADSPTSRSTSLSVTDWRRPSTWSSSSATRRTSNTSASMDPDQAYQSFVERTLSILEITRHRIQGDMLRDHGATCNDLWTLALKMLSLGRLFSAPPSGFGKGKQRAEPSPLQPKEDSFDGEGFQSKTPLHKRWQAYQGAPMIKFPTLKLGKRLVNSIEEVVQHPASPMLRKPPYAIFKPRKPASFPAPSAPTKKSAAPTSKGKGKVKKISPGDYFKKPYKSTIRLGFTEDIWRKIIAWATDAHDLMGVTQQQSVVRYALERKTIALEMENLGKPKHIQCWKTLNEMGGLEYEMKA